MTFRMSYYTKKIPQALPQISLTTNKMSALNGLGVDVNAEASLEPSCYICLQEGTEMKPLLTPCACKGRPVHRECLARWQLHSSGKSEERQCRFCYQELPDWQSTLLGSEGAPEDAPKPLVAAVVFNNTVYKIPILPGPEGKVAFKRKVNELFGLNNQMFEVAFEVKLAQADKVSLRGLNAYEAATRCAALSARRGAAESTSQ